MSWHKGNVPWNKGIKLPERTGINNPMYGKNHSKEAKEKISKAHKDKSSWNKGKHFSEDTKRKMSKAAIKRMSSWKEKQLCSKRNKGVKNPNWKGGISYEPYSVDWTITLKRSIRERDHYVCQICGDLQGDVTFCCHHIDYDKRNCNPDNLITLCNKCHTKTNCNRKCWIKYFKRK